MKISKATFQFLKDLKENNNRDWFNDNKDRYESARAEVEDFVNGLIPRIAKFDRQVAHQTAKDCMFRIFRDVRFSKDKSPYKTHFGAHISGVAKRSEVHTRAGYYLHLGPGESMLAGGAYLPPTPWLTAIRETIAGDGSGFRKILKAKSFKEHFGEIEGDKLKKAPRDFPSDHPEVELLKLKSFLAVHKCPDKLVIGEDFPAHAGKVFQAMSPLNDYLNGAMK